MSLTHKRVRSRCGKHLIEPALRLSQPVCIDYDVPDFVIADEVVQAIRRLCDGQTRILYGAQGFCGRLLSNTSKSLHNNRAFQNGRQHSDVWRR
jgi:hypothetical protein